MALARLIRPVFRLQFCCVPTIMTMRLAATSEIFNFIHLCPPNFFAMLNLAMVDAVKYLFREKQGNQLRTVRIECFES